MRTVLCMLTLAMLAALVLPLAACGAQGGDDGSARIRELEATIAALTGVQEGEQDAAPGKPSAAPRGTATAGPSATAPLPTATFPPTQTPRPTATPSPTATATPQLPRFNVILEGCGTGFDLVHGMGEVTNAYVTIQNVGMGEASNVCARLEASDVGERHPDETRCVQYLGPSREVTFKLTADTSFRVDTSIGVVVTCDEGLRVETGRGSCRKIDARLKERLEELLWVPRDS